LIEGALQFLQLKLVVSSLNMAFFFDRITDEEFGTMEGIEKITRQPAKTYVKLRSWEDVGV
jgi:hypothetical protein